MPYLPNIVVQIPRYMKGDGHSTGPLSEVETDAAGEPPAEIIVDGVTFEYHPAHRHGGSSSYVEK